MNGELVGLMVALGVGLLMGMERERSKGVGPQRGFAGIRSFALVCGGGALARASGEPGLVLLGGALVAALAVVSHWQDRSDDPGITTEVALFVAYLIGVTAVPQPALAAGVGAAATILLAARERLHEFSVRLISPRELHDALVLTGLALVLLPLLPDRPMLGAMLNPRDIGRLVLLLLAAQAAGYVGRRVLGARHGLTLAGLASGFVSSTATIAAMGARWRAEAGAGGAPDPAGAASLAAYTSAALISNVATMVQMLLVASAVRPAWLTVLWLPALCGAVAALLFALRGLFGKNEPTTHAATEDGGAFSLREALIIAALLTGVQLFAQWAHSAFGEAGLIVAAGFAGLADVHAAAAALFTQIEPGDAHGAAHAIALPLSVALIANTTSKLVAAFTAGGARYGMRVAPGLFAFAAAFALALWFAPGLLERWAG